MEKVPSFFSQLVARITSDTPIFFKKIVLFGISLGAIGLAILGVGVTPVPVPAILTTIAGYMVTVGAVCTAVAKATTTNADLQAQGGSNILVNNETPPTESKEAPESPPIPQQ